MAHHRLAPVRRLAPALVALAVACGGPHGKPVRVAIPQHSTLKAAADSLARTGVIHSAPLFRLYAKLRRGDRSIRAGTYLLRRGTSYGELLRDLREGRGAIGTVTIPEGYSLSQIVPLVSARLGIPAESLWAAASDSTLRDELDVPTSTLEGYLFPETYAFSPGTTARAVVRTMVQRFEETWKPAWTAHIDSIPMSRNDVVTLASIVEKEAKRPEERPVIAAVYLNRLRSGMLLQADPTVQYALGVHQARVLYKHLTIDSPYNTYRHKGLPPGPIASPGAPSLEAAVYPAAVPYKFFVAYPDGHHEFRTTFAEHQVAVRQARIAWDSVARARGETAAGHIPGDTVVPARPKKR